MDGDKERVNLRILAGSLGQAQTKARKRVFFFSFAGNLCIPFLSLPFPFLSPFFSFLGIFVSYGIQRAGQMWFSHV